MGSRKEIGNQGELEEGQVGLWVPAHGPGLGGEELWLVASHRMH